MQTRRAAREAAEDRAREHLRSLEGKLAEASKAREAALRGTDALGRARNAAQLRCALFSLSALKIKKKKKGGRE